MKERVTLKEVNEMTREEKAVYERFPSNLVRALLLTTDSAAAHLDLGAALTRGSLSFKDREAIVLRVAKLVGSTFERMIHYPLAIKAGLSEAEIVEIENGTFEAMTADRRALVEYITECTLNVGASEDAYRKLNLHYSQAEIADATHLAGHCWMTAMYLTSLDIPLDEAETSWSNLDRTQD